MEAKIDVKVEDELKIAFGEVLEAKFVAAISEGNAEHAVELIQHTFGFGKFDIREDRREDIVDEYFDTRDQSIKAMHASLRVRRRNGKPELTVKKLIGQELGQLNRQEYTHQMTEAQYETLIHKGTCESPLLRQHLRDVCDDRLELVLRVPNERHNFVLGREAEVYQLSFDRYRFVDPDTGYESPSQLEVEIEAKNIEARAALPDLRRSLLKLLRSQSFQFANDSKFERGVSQIVSRRYGLHNHSQELSDNDFVARRDLSRRGMMVVRPIFSACETRWSADVKKCFVIMPFSADLRKVFEEIIQPTLIGLGIETRRADDFFTQGSIMNDVWKRLNEADVIVADLTTRNPNVYYELGIAHTIGKPVILLCQDIEEVPFDIRDKRVIVYNTHFTEIGRLKDALIASVNEVRDEQKRASEANAVSHE